jgi:transposase-like protein
MSEPTQYTDEFRREVVRRADSGAISVNQLADELGLSTSTIYRWRRQLSDAALPAVEQPPKGKKGKKGKMSKKDSKDGKPKKNKDKKKDRKGKDKKKSKKDGGSKKGKKDKKKK